MFDQSVLLEQYSILLRAREDSSGLSGLDSGREKRHDLLLRSFVESGEFDKARSYISQMKSFARKRGDVAAYNLYSGYAVRIERLSKGN